MVPARRPSPPLGVVAPGGPPGEATAPVDLDTGTADRALTAAMVARARIDGAATVRTGHPAAARRAAAVIDAIVVARGGPTGDEGT